MTSQIQLTGSSHDEITKAGMANTTDNVSTSSASGPEDKASYRQIARDIRLQINSGVLRDGQVLPSTRELATTHRVSAYTISEAMKILVKEGLVDSKSRSRRVVIGPESVRQPIETNRTHAILIGGYAGSGKSEFARLLAIKTGWAVLDKDTITRPPTEQLLIAIGKPASDRESETYLTQVRPLEYEALEATVIENLECSNSVIASAPYLREFTNKAWIDRAKAQYEALNATIHFIWLHTDANTMLSYLRRRGAARDSTKLSEWHNYLATVDFSTRPLTDHTVIENSADSETLTSQADRFLNAILTT